MDYRKDPKPFYRGGITDSEGSHLVWFAPDDANQTKLRQQKLYLHLDGTFGVVPSFAKQLFIISAQVHGMVYI